ncbi:hypothetical protein P6P90_01630 [Ectobacillus antri]|jgi:penicillin V acylase-like amidase (Ntn superfamily)|uniref:Small, acid-soluble spore protein N n=1 Tax=Ectobacillus antri TaxID=2486280 RepID=A0ABT6H029_9BACI|nr:hypothetical protein [Ectobacillus antri]MDG4656025.1 hypothetical protein [Ectobacillus antri]MDG5752700.1 hypothetical protein [Ectobacillus antri]
MPYHKDKQQAFQAAQQGVKKATEGEHNLVTNDPEYAHHLKELRQEVEQAYNQIQNALETASETQRQQLESYEQQVQKIMNDMDYQ